MSPETSSPFGLDGGRPRHVCGDMLNSFFTSNGQHLLDVHHQRVFRFSSCFSQSFCFLINPKTRNYLPLRTTMRYPLTSPPPVTSYPFSSSPLNPYTHPHSITSAYPSMPSSSSSPPQSSPTPCLRQLPHPTPLFRSSPVSGKGKLSTRYQRPARKSLSSSVTTGPSNLGTRDTDLFSEGTTSLEGAMWRERFTRRMEERERRRKARNANLNRRRGIDGLGLSGVSLDEDEAERKAQEDDEEVRIMVELTILMVLMMVATDIQTHSNLTKKKGKPRHSRLRRTRNRRIRSKPPRFLGRRVGGDEE